MTTPGMKNCPYCAEEILADAVRCKHCRSWLSGNPLQNEWYRSRHGMIAGVCLGLSEQFHISVTLLRLGFVLSLFLGGAGFVAYVVLAVVMPKRPAKE
ncbi:MAG: PspC domain-containing protein [Candidatus Sumerlaeaceae bacterium]|nr:PspC domain-containing protein [Candidatus Sumerlaeaceae bacterium]